MAEFDLNLSTHPFPAYRLINIALASILVILAVLSVWQAVGFMRYSRLAGAIRTEELNNRVEAEALGKHVAELESRLDRPESTAKLNEIGFLNHLIYRKNFSWTKLYSVLEDVVPDNVHFTNITPDVGPNGGVLIRLGVRARSIPDVKEFLQRVEMSPFFENVHVTLEQKNEANLSTDVEETVSAVYYPDRDTR